MKFVFQIPQKYQFNWVEVDTREFFEKTTGKLQYHYVQGQEFPWVAAVKYADDPNNPWVYIGSYKQASAAKKAAISHFIGIAKAAAINHFLNHFER